MAVRNRAHYVQWFSTTPNYHSRALESLLQEAGETWQTPQSWRPNVDVCETDEAAVVTIELPGVRQEDIDLTYDSGRLIVRGVREPLKPAGVRSCQRIEIQYGPFERVIPIFCRIDRSENITAAYRDGFLEVRLPKVQRTQVESVKVDIA